MEETPNTKGLVRSQSRTMPPPTFGRIYPPLPAVPAIDSSPALRAISAGKGRVLRSSGSEVPPHNTSGFDDNCIIGYAGSYSHSHGGDAGKYNAGLGEKSAADVTLPQALQDAILTVGLSKVMNE